MPAAGKKYDVTDSDDKNRAWCGYRVVVLLGTVISVMMYTVGAIISGIAYRAWDRGVNCTALYSGGAVLENHVFGYNTPLVVVGPVLMGIGATIVAVLLIQWCCCRPAVTHTMKL